MSPKIRFFLLFVAPLLAILLALLGVVTLSTNLLGWFILFIGLGYLTAGFIYFRRLPAPEVVVREERSDRSFWLILPGFLAVFYAAPLEYLYAPKILPRGPWTQYVGFILIFLGLLLRVWTRLTIRDFYTGHVQVSAQHRLVQDGPYRFIRHPGYAGFILFALGLACGFSSLLALLATFLLLIPGLAYRMRVEEKLLEEQFGEEFRQYSRNTRLLIPGIW